MPANIETGMFSQQQPWHHEGIFTEDALTSAAAAMAMAGLDWTVEQRKLYTQYDDVEWIELTEHMANVRVTDGKVLSVTSPSYEILQPVEAFAWLDSLTDAGEIEYHTAGSLDGGKKIWVLARLNNADFDAARGDQWKSYLLFLTGFDGATSTRVLFTTIRVVCANTLAMALSKDGKGAFRQRHTKGQYAALEGLRDSILGVRNEVKEFGSFVQHLGTVQVTEEAVVDFAKYVIPGDSKRTDNRRTTLRDLIEGGVGQDLAGVTAQSLLNGATEYATWYSGSKKTTQQDRWKSLTTNGSAAQLNGRALSFVGQLAEAA